VLRIESRYGIELDADDGGELRTLRDLAQLVLRRLEDEP
jgi:acyl carrier protein